MGAVLEECRVREESEDAHPDVERRHVGDSSFPKSSMTRDLTMLRSQKALMHLTRRSHRCPC